MDNEKRQDESELIAASALDDMRKGAKQSPRAGSSSGQATVAATYSEGFVGRMTGIPLVNSALRVYEQGKASSRVVKYGAQMVESGVKTISKPVINRLPVDVNSLDEFACRQLDRLDRYRRPSVAEKTPTSPEPPTSPSPSSSHVDITLSPTSSVRGRSSSSSKGKSPEIEVNDDATATIKEKPRRRGSSWLNAARSPFTPASPPAQDSDVTESGRPPPSNTSTNANTNNANTSEDRQVAQRSRWQTMLLEAGGLSAALSEESMKRLKYCLEWLMFATSHIDAQILVLRDFIASLQPLPPSSPHSSSHSNHTRASVSQHHLKTLAAARRDIVHTVRQVVDVVSKYAGGALPEPARAHVRGFILQLPQRWAKKAPGQGGGPSPGTGDVELDRMATAPANATGIGVGSGKESVAAAATGGGAVRRGRRAGHRERGAGAGPSNPPSRPSSPSRHSRHHSINQIGDSDGSSGANGSGGSGEQVSATTAIVAAQKILTLATESLDMMRGVTGVVKDSLDKADAWVGRLRAVGIERRGSAHEGDPQEQDMASPHSATPTSPQPSSTFPANASTNGFRNHRHTRNISDLSELDEFELPHSLHRRGGGRDRAGSIDSDMDGPPSPFYSTSSLRSFSTLGSMETMSTGTSTTGSENGNSIPSTPGASYVLPPSHLYQSTYPSGPYAPGSGYGRSSNLAGPGVYASSSSSGAPSPPNGGGANQLGLGLGSMRIDSRGGSVASTPKSVLGRELDDEDEGVVPNVKMVNGGNENVKVVGMDVELIGGEGREGERMDIDS